MNGDNLENELTRLGQTWPHESSIVDDVISRVAVESQRSSRPSKRRTAMRINAAIAAGVVCCLGLWWAIFPSTPGSRLYASMKDALEKVDSFRVVTSVVNADGELNPAAQTWFQRNRGFAVDQPDVIRIDSGESFWEYRKGGTTAIRRRSQDTDLLLDQAIGFKEELEQDCKRFEAGDKTIDGLDLKCYQVTFHSARKPTDQTLLDFSKRRTYVYVDNRALLYRIESLENHDGVWRLMRVRRWEYNVDIDPQVFVPDFGDHVAIIDADKVFEDLTNAARSIWTEERDGLIYTIHEAQLFQSGGVLVMSSVRGTEETLKKYPLRRRMIQPGLYITDVPAMNYQASPLGSGYFRLSLARARQNGVDVEWWMMVPRGRKPNWFKNDNNQVELRLGITPWGEYGKTQHADDRGVIRHITWTQALDLPEPQALPALADVAKQVYQTMSLLAPQPGTDLDMGIEEVDGEPRKRHAFTRDVSCQEFVDAVYDHWRWWENRDLEWQLTTGVKSTSLPGVDRGYPSHPSIGLSYNFLVDDRTLDRAAQNPELERLWINGTRITDDGLAALSNLEHLRLLDISDTEISDAGLRHLETIESLETVTANQTNVSTASVQRLKEAIPGLDVQFSQRGEE